MKLIQTQQEHINELCKKYKVTLLYVFGSVLTKKFSEKSDIDFLVYFDSIPILDYADNFFDFQHELEKVFDRKIDLVSGKALKNPYFIKSIEATKQLIFDTNNLD